MACYKQPSWLPPPPTPGTLTIFVTIAIVTLAFATIFMDKLCNLLQISEPKISPHSGAKAQSQLSYKKGCTFEKIGMSLPRWGSGLYHFGESTRTYPRPFVHCAHSTGCEEVRWVSGNTIVWSTIHTEGQVQVLLTPPLKVLLICRSLWWVWGVGGLCASKILEAMPAGVLTPGKFNHAGQALR